MNDLASIPGAVKRDLHRIAIRTRENDVTRAAWRLEVDSEVGSGSITLVDLPGESLHRGDGIFLGWSQEGLAAAYAALNTPPDDEPVFELQQLG